MKACVKALLVLTFVFAAAWPTAASEAILTRRASLRSDPSATHPPILWLNPPEDVELIEPAPTHGYYHVRTSDKREGWIYGRSLQVVPGQPAPSTGPATGTGHGAGTSGSATHGPSPGTGTGAGVVSQIPPDWEKPAPNETQFDGGDGTCGPSGDGGDTTTNLRKNRTDVPATYHETTWKAIQTLPYPNAGRSLADWTPDQFAIIQPYEGDPVSVVGYLVAIKVEDRGSGESTNCHFTNPEEVDWHMPLVEQPGQAEATAIVVETTPRVRRQHPKWTVTNISPWHPGIESFSGPAVSAFNVDDPAKRDAVLFGFLHVEVVRLPGFLERRSSLRRLQHYLPAHAFPSYTRELGVIVHLLDLPGWKFPR